MADMQAHALAARRAKKDGTGSGPLPWGYTRDALGHIIIDYIPSVIIQCLFAVRDTGKSIRQTAAALDEAGYTTQQGGRWSAASVQGILRHEGLYRYGIRSYDGVEAPDRWPIIVQPRQGILGEL